MSLTRISRGVSSAGALAAAALALAACGSSGSHTDAGGAAGQSSHSTSSGASAGSGINVHGAKRDLAAYMPVSNNLGVPTLGAPIPKSKTVDVITCPVAICTEDATGVQQATKLLGWQFRDIAMNATPAGYLQAWQQIDQSPGNGVVVIDPVLPDSSIQSHINKAGVPVVPIVENSAPAGLVKAVVASNNDVRVDAGAEADWVIQDAGKPVKTVFVYDPSITSVASAYPGFVAAMSKNCPACSVATLKVSVLQIGPKLAAQVVSYLQANPDVKYVAFGLGDLATGVPAAIKAAGLDHQVKLVTRAATPPNLEDVATGGMAAAFTSETYESSYWAVTVLLEAMDHKPIDGNIPTHDYLFTPSHPAANAAAVFSVPGYVSQFKHAWGLS